MVTNQKYNNNKQKKLTKSQWKNEKLNELLWHLEFTLKEMNRQS